MSIRTDLQMHRGKLRAVNQDNADTVRELPKVEPSDALQSDAWGDAWRKEAGAEDPAIEALAGTQADISRTFKGFMELRGMRDPERTQAYHLRQIAQDFEKSLNRLAEKSDRAQERAKQRLEEIEGQFRARMKWNGQDAQELRSVVRGMSAKDRSAFIDQAIQSGDGQALAALLGGHPSLSGLTADMQSAYRKRAMQLHTPELLRAERTIQKAVGTTRQAFLDLLARSDAITAKKVREKYEADQKAAYEARMKTAER